MTDSPPSLSGLTLREEYKLATRRRLVAAAQRVFMRSGYSSASIDEIAAAARVSRATLYLHFSSKSDLIGAVTEELQQESSALIRRLLPILADGTRDELREWLRSALAWLDSFPLVRATQEAQLVEPERTANSVREGIFQILDPWFETWPQGRQAEARVRLELCRLQLQHFSWGKTRKLLSVDDEVVIDVLTDFWWSTLREPLAATG